jgi:hypothetical protein
MEKETKEINVYILNSSQVQKINEINNETKNHAVVCNHGYGDCIEADIVNAIGYEQHTAYLNEQNLKLSSITIID